MKLVNIEDCDRELFYKQCGGKDSLINVETAFNMLMTFPIVSETEIYNGAIEDFKQELKDYVYHEKLKGNEPYWTNAIDTVASEMTR